VPGLGSRNRKTDADFEPFVKLPPTSDINGFVVRLLALLNEDHNGQQRLPVLQKKSADCRSFTLPRLQIVWWFRFTAVLRFQDLAIPFPDVE